MTAIWVYARIQSPFLLFCSYGLIKRFEKLASPWLVAPSVAGICALFYLVPFGGDFPPFYFHLPMAAFFILSAYFLLSMRFGYSKPDALVLSLLTFMAIDELWQTDINLVLWTQSLHNFEVGMTTAAWNYMSLPFIGYFLLKFTGRLKANDASIITLAFSLAATGTSLFFPPNLTTDYLLVLPWFTFFLVLFQSCKQAPFANT